MYKKRDSMIDLMRCIFMFLIVLHHVICHTLLASDFSSAALFFLTVPAVDGFIAISGRYGVSLKVGKIVSILGQVVFYATISSSLSYFVCGGGASLGHAWYAYCYVALLCFSPIFNAGIAKINGYGIMMLILLYSATWLGSAGHLGFSIPGFGSHTFMTFALVYIIVRWLFEKVGPERIPRGILLVGLALSISLYCCISCVMMITQKSVIRVMLPWNGYNSPLVVVIAVLLVLLASRIKFVSERFDKIVAFLTPSLFAVYLIHDANPFLSHNILVGPVERIANLLDVSRSIVAFVCAVGVFCASILFDLIFRRFPWAVAKRVLRKK